VELRKKEQLLERRSEQLNVSKRVIAEQEEELAEVTKELQETERQNSRLRQSMEKMLEESEHNKYSSWSTPSPRSRRGTCWNLFSVDVLRLGMKLFGV
ncbi:hypothetical protein GOODEAATRI_012356, partial [Goodea atripinnis]